MNKRQRKDKAISVIPSEAKAAQYVGKPVARSMDTTPVSFLYLFIHWGTAVKTNWQFPHDMEVFQVCFHEKKICPALPATVRYS